MQQLIIVHRGYSGEKLNEFIGRGRRAPTPGGMSYAGYYKRIRTPGSFKVGINAQDERILTIEPFHTFEFWVRDMLGGTLYDEWLESLPAYMRDPFRPRWYRDFSAMVLMRPRIVQTSEGQYASEILGRGMNEWLYSEPIDYAPGTSQTDKTGKAETVAKEWVNENIGPGAGVDKGGYSRVRSALSIEADQARGGDWDGQRSRKKLGEVLQEVATLSSGPGDFMIVQTGDRAYEFQWRSPHWGEDKRLGNSAGNAPVVFSARRNNVESIVSDESYMESVTAVTVYGQGAGSLLKPGTAHNDEFIGITDFARKAIIGQSRNSLTQAALDNAAFSKLWANWPDINVTAKIKESASTRYGRTWGAGDLVTIEDTQTGRRNDRKILGVRVNFAASDGLMTFVPEFGDFIDA